MKNENLKIVFMGTPEFGAVILEKLTTDNYKPALVIAAPEKPVGRKQIITPPPVKIIAQKYNIPISQPVKIQDAKFQIQSLSPDLIIVAAYGQIIQKNILDLPKYGCLNVHPSLLPRHRGASPVQTAILNENQKTGVTIILMDEKIDHGPILASQELEFQISNFKFQELQEELAKLGAELLIKTIPDWINGKIKPKPQDETRATYTKILKKEDGKIDWGKPAKEIEKQIRALNPWPGSYTIIELKTQGSKLPPDFATPKVLRAGKTATKNLKIIAADILTTKTNGKVGEIFLTDKNKITVRTGQDCLILKELQIEGGKPISAEEFIRGHKGIIGITLK